MRRRPVKRKLTTYQVRRSKNHHNNFILMNIYYSIDISVSVFFFFQFHTGSITKDEKGNIVRISRHKPAMKHDKTLWWCCAMCRTVRHYDDIGIVSKRIFHIYMYA